MSTAVLPNRAPRAAHTSAYCPGDLRYAAWCLSNWRTNGPALPDVEVSSEERSYTYTQPVPVFYGHYWRNGSPQHTRDWTTHCACVDFSAAKGGRLTAYRWSGESTIAAENYWQCGG